MTQYMIWKTNKKGYIMRNRTSKEFVMSRKNDRFVMNEVEEEFGSDVKQVKAVAVDFGWALICQGLNENNENVGDSKRVQLRSMF